jgi:hypothetical protein
MGRLLIGFTHVLHSATSQKTAFFIVTAVKTSNPTKCSCIGRLLIGFTQDLHGTTSQKTAFFRPLVHDEPFSRKLDTTFAAPI